MIKNLFIYLGLATIASSATAKVASIRLSPVSSLLGSPSGEVSFGVAKHFSLGLEANYYRSLKVVDELIGVRSREVGGRLTATVYSSGFDSDSFYLKVGGGARRMKFIGFRQGDYDGIHGEVTRDYNRLEVAPMIGYQWVAGGPNESGFTMAIGIGSVFAYSASDVDLSFSRRDSDGDPRTVQLNLQPINIDSELRIGFAI